ncbi:hypothetical protein [Ktedonosporobacter rubrisoli]|nr:hypothetical protein [Ktedonosporobacter rubrisoli]
MLYANGADISQPEERGKYFGLPGAASGLALLTMLLALPAIRAR